MRKLLLIAGIILFTSIGVSSCFTSNQDQTESKVQQLLKKYKFQDLTARGGTVYVMVLFEDNLAKFTLKRFNNPNYDITDTDIKTENWTYKIRIGDNKQIFVDIISNTGEKQVYEFLQEENGRTHLNGNFDLYAYSDKTKDEFSIEDSPVQNADDIIDPNIKEKAKHNLTPVKVDTSRSTVEIGTVRKEVVYDTAVKTVDSMTEKRVDEVRTNTKPTTDNFEPFLGKVIVSKSFFHDLPDPLTIRKGYLVENQEMKIEKENGNFYFGIYSNPNGKTTQGWVLKTTIQK